MLKHRSAGRTRTLVTRLRGNRTALVTIALVMSLLAGGAALARRGGPATESKGSQVTPASLTPSTPSKEYIYAGGRLIATEEPAGSTCSYSILPTSQSFAASGGPGNVTVTVAAGCPWTATSNAAWITINSGTPGNGNGSVGFTVAANSGGARNGTMTIAGQTFTVSQDAAGGGGTAPSLSGLSPVTAIQGASFTLTINGSNLAGATSVNFSPPDDVTITNINSTASQVTCSVSIGAAAATGGRLVTVTTASGGTSTNFLAFGINSSSQAPTISSISPSKKARGTTFTLTINGTNLSQTSSVNFNSPAGITVSNIVVVSAGQVTATVSISSGAATGIRQVSVTALGVDSNTKPFTVQ